MTTAGFKRSLSRTLVHEGGKVDDPHDPGGRTNQGVTQRVYDGYRRRRKLAPRDVFLMEPKERDAIYRLQYWNAVRANELPAGIDFVVFDGAVNSGPGQSIKWLQRALTQAGCYTGKIDGNPGEATLRACEQHPNHDALVAAICERRLIFLKELKTWKRYKGGWSKRVVDVRYAGQAWASGSTEIVTAEFTENANERATTLDAKEPPSTLPADSTTGGGVVTETISTVQQSIEPMSGVSGTASTIYTLLAVLGALAIAGGILWGLYVRKRRERLNDALDSSTPATLGYSS